MSVERPARLDLSRSHRGINRVEVWSRGDGLLSSDVEIIDGTVTDRYLTGIRRSLSLSVPPSSQWLRWAKLTDLEVRVFSGFTFGGSDVLVPLGRFPISPPAVALPATAISISADDYWSWVKNRDFLYPFPVGPGTFYDGLTKDIMAYLIEEVLLGKPVNTATSQAVLPSMVVDKSRTQTIFDGLESIAAEGFFDRDGQPVVRDRVPTVGLPLSDGEDGTVISVTSTQNWDEVFNEVGVTSSNNDTKFFTVTVQITDPAHPAHWSGSLGHKGFKYSSPFLASEEQGRAAGVALLAKKASPALSWSVTAVPDPFRDAGDRITVTTGLGTVDAVIQEITHSLTGKAQTMTLGAA